MQAEQTYAFSGHILKNDRNVAAAYLRVSWYRSTDGSGQLIESDDSERITADYDGFIPITTGPIEAPPGAQSVRVRILLDPVSSGVGRIYFDDMMFTESVPGPPFVEPTSASGGTRTAEATARTPGATRTPTRTPTPSGTGLAGPVATSPAIRTSTVVPGALPAEVVTILRLTFVPVPVVLTIDRAISQIEAAQPAVVPPPMAQRPDTNAPAASTRTMAQIAQSNQPSTVGHPWSTSNKGRVVITEVMANPQYSGVDSNHEWFELYNDGDAALDLLGWMIEDDGGTDFLPSYTLEPEAFVIVASSQRFFDEFPDYDGPVLVIQDGGIGNGLSNTGDELVLRDAAGREIDSLSYGTNRKRLDPAAPLTAGGSSIERTAAHSDAEFIVNHYPSPGVPFEIRIVPAPREQVEVAVQDDTAEPHRISLIDITPVALLFGVPLFLAARKSRIHR